MNYPSWDVPVIGSGLVIAIIAIFHVMISHFAVGGGFYLPMAEWKAHKMGREDWMIQVQKHSKFFLILTLVFGAVSGVGIWFAIGLASPEGTSALIHNFVFGWAIEWVFFIVEITAALLYYYTWGRLPFRQHMILGWIYAGSAWASLVIINGILTFMLTTGTGWASVAGSGTEADMFWAAFFNPGYFPSLILRTLICINLAAIWALVTASRIDGYAQPKLKTEIVRWSVKWLIPSFVLVPFAFAWYLYTVPASQLSLLQFGVATIGSGTFTQVTRVALVTVMTSATIVGVVYFLAWRNPRDFSFGHALSILALALAATASTEFGREMLRKPYVIGGFMYSNGVRITEVEAFNRDGYLTTTIWATPAERELWARASGEVVAAADSDVGAATLARGELMFRGQCMACHTVDGYRPMKTYLQGRDRESIASILGMLHDYKEDSTYRAYMPPLVGTADEIAALGTFLEKMVAPEEHAAPEQVAQGK